MKRCIVLFSILIGLAAMLAGCDLNRLGKAEYYVQITMDGKEIKGKTDNGEQFTDYEYKLPGFDKDGKEKTMEFRAFKNLRKDAFLRVYYSEKKGVTAWEEVKKDEIPANAQEKLGVK